MAPIAAKLTYIRSHVDLYFVILNVAAVIMLLNLSTPKERKVWHASQCRELNPGLLEQAYILYSSGYSNSTNSAMDNSRPTDNATSCTRENEFVCNAALQWASKRRKTRLVIRS